MADLTWTVGTWGGQPNYRCSRCPFATMSLPNMEAHWASKHAATPAENLALANAETKPRPKREKRAAKKSTPVVKPEIIKNVEKKAHSGTTSIDSTAVDREIPGHAADSRLSGLRMDTERR